MRCLFLQLSFSRTLRCNGDNEEKARGFTRSRRRQVNKVIFGPHAALRRRQNFREDGRPRKPRECVRQRISLGPEVNVGQCGPM